jgi:hypothetical protein
VCPLCGRNRALEAQTKGRVRWDFFDPEKSSVIQIREAHGKLPSDEQPENRPKKPGMAKAGGFPLKQGLTWQEIKESPEFKDQISQMQKQIQRIYILCD